MGLCPLAGSDCGFESCQGYGCLPLLSVVCCQVQAYATGWSLVQRIPTKRGVSECECEVSIMRITWPTRGCCAKTKKKSVLFSNYEHDEDSSHSLVCVIFLPQVSCLKLNLTVPSSFLARRKVRIWKLANSSSWRTDIEMPPCVSFFSFDAGQYCMHITWKYS